MSHALILKGAVKEYPYSFARLRADNPDVSFPRDPDDDRLAEFGVFRVAKAEPPAHALDEDVTEGVPALVGKVWTQTWSVVAASAEDYALRQAAADDEDRRREVKADAFVSSFVAMTPAQVAAYVDANITSIASAKAVIAKLAIMVLVMMRREVKR